METRVFKIILISFIIFSSCKRLPQDQSGRKEISHIVFVSSQFITLEGEENLRKVWSKMAENVAICDSAAYDRLTSYDIVESFRQIKNDTINLHITLDSIYSTSRSGSMTLSTDTKSLTVRNRIGRIMTIDTIQPDSTQLYTLKYKDSIRVIQGFQCQKVLITSLPDPDETLNLGNHIIEIWGTPDIPIPAKIIDKDLPHLNIFPLHIIEYEENLKGIETVVECISIE